ncbi:integrase catalytic domain-containing protein [Trichonephila clavata]|uniref:Integrase catalytic domain-containing protein n=1 Tax=Trichonephila clavata TaxID=2740835 RepID=A0A8X6KCU7_TRICU|nr:integrase catalytic domain-containing protein [Trichonephila clavata]
MRKIWEIDNLGITDNIERESSEEETLKQFEQNIKFKNGRYEVRLPFKDEVNMTSNFNLAKNRLMGLASRFREDNSLYANYTSVLDSQLTDGIIKSVNTENLNQNLIYYMPHHSIIRNDKETTKLRIVFDASSKEKNCFSLNYNLKAGPNLN